MRLIELLLICILKRSTKIVLLSGKAKLISQGYVKFSELEEIFENLKEK